MSDTADIKRRINSVRETRKITGAMETVSVAKLRKVTELYEQSRLYFEVLGDIMSSLAASYDTDERFETGKNSGDDVVIVLSTDRGLCVGFDQALLRKADEVITDGTVVFPVGRYACEHYKKHARADMKFGGKYAASVQNADEIAAELIAMGDKLKSASIVYSPIGRSGVSAEVMRLLPVPLPAGVRAAIDCFEPSKADVYEKMLPLYLSGSIYNAFINNIASEHAARRAAMKNATDSADEIISSLTLEYNRARQMSVTNQIVEIIGSTEALKHKESPQ